MIHKADTERGEREVIGRKKMDVHRTEKKAS